MMMMMMMMIMMMMILIIIIIIMLVLWNQAVHTDRKVTANRPYVIIKNKKREDMHTDRCGNTCTQKCRAEGSGK
jgi:uncharacterized membrane protein